MKRKLLIALLLSIVSFNEISYATSSGNDLVQVILNGQNIVPEVSPRIVNNRTMVPIRDIISKVGGSIEWNSSENSVVIKNKNDTIVFKIGQNTAKVNDEDTVIEVPPYILEGRTMVPLRFIATKLDMNVEWIDRLKTATVTDNDYFNSLSKDVVMGFTVSYYTGDNLSYNSVKSSQKLNMVSVFSYSFDTNGNIKLADEEQKNTVEYAKGKNIIPLAVIHNINNGQFDQEILHDVLVNEQARQNLINNIVIMLAQHGYSGVNIDFENIKRSDKDYYTTFISELKGTLTKYGYLTTVSVAAKTSDVYTSSWNYAFDYKRLGELADYVMIMAYDEHYKSSMPGPIASINWVRDILDYAQKQIPTQKIILGLALYGYDWQNSTGQAVPAKNVANLAKNNNVNIKWDENSKTPYFSYIKGNVYHEVWYENEESLKLKINLAKQYNLGGVGFWRLGLEEQGVLDKIVK